MGGGEGAGIRRREDRFKGFGGEWGVTGEGDGRDAVLKKTGFAEKDEMGWSERVIPTTIAEGTVSDVRTGKTGCRSCIIMESIYIVIHQTKASKKSTNQTRTIVHLNPDTELVIASRFVRSR